MATSCDGPRQSLLTGEPMCSADIYRNWPEDGDWDAFCRECREGFERGQERLGDCERDDS